ncbi:MAG TPA: FAD-binding oxidoreductase [Gemmatimonadaceae bacterium]|jgi:aclacinomycin oxidase
MTDSPKIGPDDPRYRAVLDRQFNKRHHANPDYVRLAQSTEDVVASVDDAVRDGKRLVVTSGGHCLEGFVSDPDVRVIIDVSPMKRIYHDAQGSAIAVECGATVGETFKALADNWGTVIPLGEYPAIGIGGHVLGGAFGFLCRRLGLAADYLYGVEVVTVGVDGRAQVVVATRDDSGDLGDLWWAHTGGGGGNFGIVTRYWFRDVAAKGVEPAQLLPEAPHSVSTLRAEWSWDALDEHAFTRLMNNHGMFSEQTSGADSEFATLWTLFEIHRHEFGKVFIRGVSTAGDRAPSQFDELLARLCDGGVAAPVSKTVERMSWLDFALHPLPDLFAGGPPSGVSTKIKDAIVRRALTDAQIAVVYRYLHSTDVVVPGGMFGLASYGGRINTRATDAAAAPQRNGILDVACNTGWVDAKDEAQNVEWVRTFYRDLFSETGGVPVPGDAYDGALINHPDVDLSDPQWNTSGVPWSTIYYQGNYPRLQRVKSRWDPRDVFRHALSIRGNDFTAATR